MFNLSVNKPPSTHTHTREHEFRNGFCQHCCPLYSKFVHKFIMKIKKKHFQLVIRLKFKSTIADNIFNIFFFITEVMLTPPTQILKLLHKICNNYGFLCVTNNAFSKIIDLGL